jgi:polyhydroxyalkanoate synthesis repressor PhaR
MVRMVTPRKTRGAEAPSASAAEAAGAAGAPVSGAAANDSQAGMRVLKKYPNRRLYDTRSSSYITLADVKQMVLANEAFEVRDAKSGEDLTRSILLQIILEEESGGVPMFSAVTLAQIIRFYGHAMQGVMGQMLEQNMATFAELQQRFLAQGAGVGKDFGKGFTPELWTQWLSGQPTMVQSLMDGYVEQGRQMLEQMQRGGALFPGIGGFPPGRK